LHESIELKKLFHIINHQLSTSSEEILALKIGERHCCFAITDISGKNLHQLAYYSSNQIDENSLATLFSNHQELNDSFSKVMICYDFNQTILMPEKYFNPEEANKLLKAVFALNNQSLTSIQSIPGYDLHNIYSTPKDVNDWVNRKFSNRKCFHNHSVGIQAMNNKDGLLIDFWEDEFSLIFTSKEKLLLAQTFSYSNPEDVLYYLLKTIQQFSFSQKEVKLTISGLIEKESALFKELYNYFLNIEFKNSYWQSDDEYPKHFFSSLNDLVQCAS